MRRPICLLAVAATVAGVAGAPGAGAADVGTARIYLHSAGGSYAADAAGTAPYSAPAGSTATAQLPTKTTSATALSQGRGVPGGPLTPTWSQPLTGALHSVCVDLYIDTTAITANPPAVNQTAWAFVRLVEPGPTATATAYGQAGEKWPDGVARLTSWQRFSPPVEITPATLLTLTGEAQSNPDWTLHYDSVTHPSSVTVNLAKESCTTKVLDRVKR